MTDKAQLEYEDNLLRRAKLQRRSLILTGLFAFAWSFLILNEVVYYGVRSLVENFMHDAFFGLIIALLLTFVLGVSAIIGSWIARLSFIRFHRYYLILGMPCLLMLSLIFLSLLDKMYPERVYTRHTNKVLPEGIEITNFYLTRFDFDGGSHFELKGDEDSIRKLLSENGLDHQGPNGVSEEQFTFGMEPDMFCQIKVNWDIGEVELEYHDY